MITKTNLPILKDYFSYLVAKITPGLTGLLSIVLFFNILGPKEYGRYSLLFSFVNMCSAFSFGWLGQSIVRYYIKMKNNNNVSDNIIGGSIIASFVSLIIISGFQYFEFPHYSNPLVLWILAISIGGFTISSNYFQSKQNPSMVLKLNILQAILSVVVPLILLNVFNPIHFNMIKGLIVAYSTPFIIIVLKRKYKTIKKLNFSLKTIQPLMQYGVPLSFWFVISLSLRFMERYFVEYYLGSDIMGSYAGYVEVFTRMFSIILFPLTLAVHPRIMNLWNNNNIKEAKDVLKQSLFLQASALAILLILFIPFKTNIFNLILSIFPELDDSLSPILIPIVLSGFIWQYALLIHKPLELKEKSGTMLLFILVSAIITIIGNNIFLPKYGILATAYTSVASGIIYLLLSTIASRALWLRH